MPKFVIDEDMPRSTAKLLRDSGYEAFDIRDHHLRSAPDNKIFQFAQSLEAVLITGDMGFSNILHFPLGTHHGILVAHFPNHISPKELNSRLLDNVKNLAEEDFSGNLIIIEPGKIRIRKKQ